MKLVQRFFGGLAKDDETMHCCNRGDGGKQLQELDIVNCLVRGTENEIIIQRLRASPDEGGHCFHG